MPTVFAGLLLIGKVKELAPVKLLERDRADDADFVVGPAISTIGIQNGMDVEPR